MKKSLVILSGWGVDKFVWGPIVEMLKGEFEIFIIDWSDILSLEGIKYKVLRLLRKKGIERFSLLGWSLGSLVGLDLARTHSSKIDNLILLSPTCKFVKDSSTAYDIGWHKKILKRMITMLKSCPEETLESFFRNLFTEEEVENEIYHNYLKKVKSLDSGYSVESLVLGLEYLMQRDLREDIKNINIPALILHGDEDMICPVESGRYIRENLKESKLVILKKTGHIPFYTKTSHCYELIINYISNKEGW